MLKNKKVIALILMFTFMFSTYSVAFAATTEELTGNSTEAYSSTETFNRDEAIAKIINETNWTQAELEKLSDKEIFLMSGQELQKIYATEGSPRNPVIGLGLRAILSPEKIAQLINAGLLSLMVILGVDMDMAPVGEIAGELQRDSNNTYYQAYLDIGNRQLLVGSAISKEDAKLRIVWADTFTGNQMYKDAGNIYTHMAYDARSLATYVGSNDPAHDDKCKDLPGYYKHFHPTKANSSRYQGSHIFYFS